MVARLVSVSVIKAIFTTNKYFSFFLKFDSIAITLGDYSGLITHELKVRFLVFFFTLITRLFANRFGAIFYIILKMGEWRHDCWGHRCRSG